MSREKEIEEMAKILCRCDSCDKRDDAFNYLGYCKCTNWTKNFDIAKNLVNAGYRKMDEITLRLDLGDRTPEEIKQIAEMFNGEIKKQVAKEILHRVVNICKNEEDFQDGTVNTQLEPLYFGIANGCSYVKGEVKELAKEYGLEIDE